MEKLVLLYKMKAVDEFDRYFESNAKVSAQYLMFKDQADAIYLQMMEQLVAHILWRMGSETNAEWHVEVEEEIN